MRHFGIPADAMDSVSPGLLHHPSRRQGYVLGTEPMRWSRMHRPPAISWPSRRWCGGQIWRSRVCNWTVFRAMPPLPGWSGPGMRPAAKTRDGIEISSREHGPPFPDIKRRLLPDFGYVPDPGRHRPPACAARRPSRGSPTPGNRKPTGCPPSPRNCGNSGRRSIESEDALTIHPRPAARGRSGHLSRPSHRHELLHSRMP